MTQHTITHEDMLSPSLLVAHNDNQMVPGSSVCVQYFSPVRLFVIPWTVAYLAPLSMEFSRQEYWSGLPFPTLGDLPNPGIKSASLGVSCFDRQILWHSLT